MGSNHIGTIRWNVFSSEPCSLVWRNSISIEIWWDLVCKNSFLHVLRHRPTQKYGFFANSANIPWSGFKHKCQLSPARTILHHNRQLRCLIFCYRRVSKTILNSQRLKGTMLPCILLHATACQVREFSLDLLHAKFISISITIDCSPRPPAPVRNFLPPLVNENTLAWNSHIFMGAMYPHILLPKDCL